MSSTEFNLKGLPKSFLRLLVVSFVIKLVVSAILPLTNDEAYYWVWSHHMQLSFFDHPPAVAWLFWLTHVIENWGASARWAGVAFGQATVVVWLLLLRPILTEKQLWLWLWLALLSPLIGAGSLLITPDIPLLFFWALTLLLFLRWLEQPTSIRALLLGLSCGLGFCSKYVMILQPMFLFFAALTNREWRRCMKKGWWAILMGIVIGSIPVWLWNYLNDFASFRFQADHGLGRHIWKPSWTYEYILGQFALIFPTVVIWAMRGTKKAPVWLWLLAWGPLGFFALTSFKGYAEANWPIVAYAEIFALAVLVLPFATLGFRITMGTWALALFGLVALITTRWSPTGEPIKTKEFFEFEVLRPVAAAADRQPIFARSYQMASQLSFDLKRPIAKLRGMNRRDFFDYLPESQPSRDVFFVMAEKEDTLPDPLQMAGYKIVSRTPVPNSDTFDVWEVRK